MSPIPLLSPPLIRASTSGSKAPSSDLRLPGMNDDDTAAAADDNYDDEHGDDYGVDDDDGHHYRE